MILLCQCRHNFPSKNNSLKMHMHKMLAEIVFIFLEYFIYNTQNAVNIYNIEQVLILNII
jgi:hypothetical protein